MRFCSIVKRSYQQNFNFQLIPGVFEYEVDKLRATVYLASKNYMEFLFDFIIHVFQYSKHGLIQNFIMYVHR